MIALVPVRHGVLPFGAADAIAEADGRVILAGSDTSRAEIQGLASEVFLVELGPVEMGRWASLLAAALAAMDDTDIIVLPHSPDGRDLAPRIASALERPLLAGAIEVGAHRVRVARRGGLGLDAPPVTHELTLGADVTADAHDAVVVEVLPPDVQTMDLTEASRIVGGGAGLESNERFAQLDRFAGAIGGVMGATRVITDRAWVHHDRQIGTTGVVIDPELYLSFGVSGAVQHTSGLGHPDHIISVNTDPHCPMMAMSDLAIVADANETLDELLRLLAVTSGVRSSQEAPQ